MPKVVSPKIFPLCFIYPSVAIELPEILFGQAMEAYWRVKKWQISFSAVFVLVPDVGTPLVTGFNHLFTLETGKGIGFDGELPSFYSGGVAPTSESELVCGPGTTWGVEIGSGDGAPIGGTVIQFAAAGLYGDGSVGNGLVFFQLSNAGYFLYGGKLFIPCAFFGTLSGFAIVSFADPLPVGWPIVTDAGNFVINLNSGTITKKIFCGSVNNSTIKTNIIMTPVEYWSYGGTWDVSTGFPL